MYYLKSQCWYLDQKKKKSGCKSYSENVFEAEERLFRRNNTILDIVPYNYP